MTHAHTHRTAAGTVLAALALGIATPAAPARPFDLNQRVSEVRPASAQVYVPPASLAPHLARVTSVYVPPASLAPRVAPGPTAQHSTGSGTTVWEFVAVGSGAAALTLIGVGGTRAAGRRRRRIAGAPSVPA